MPLQNSFCSLPSLFLLSICVRSTCLGGLFDSIITPVTPEVETSNMFLDLETRILQYCADHKAIPKRLSDLPVRPDYDDRVTDGWHRPIAYSPQKDGSILLTSPGPVGDQYPRSIRFSIISFDEHCLKELDTFNAMGDDEKLIRDFAVTHDRLPVNLKELQDDIHTSASTLDGWGNPMDYDSMADGTVTLTSHGHYGNQIFSSRFVVLTPSRVKAAAKPEGKPLTVAGQLALQKSMEGKYTAINDDGTDMSMTIDANSITYSSDDGGKVVYNYKVIGGRGDKLALQLYLLKTGEYSRQTIMLHGGELDTDSQDSPQPPWHRVLDANHRG